jgi:hypothetical protein
MSLAAALARSAHDAASGGGDGEGGEVEVALAAKRRTRTVGGDEEEERQAVRRAGKGKGKEDEDEEASSGRPEVRSAAAAGNPTGRWRRTAHAAWLLGAQVAAAVLLVRRCITRVGVRWLN